MDRKKSQSIHAGPGRGTCLVTGAGGFIGSHLVAYLTRMGYRVRAMVRYSSSGAGSAERLLGLGDMLDDIEIVKADVRDYDSTEKAVAGCDMVIHLAALIGIPWSYVSPEAYIKTNVMGARNVLEASLRHEVSKVIMTSTSEVYGRIRADAINEEHPRTANSPYAASKIAADELAISYRRSFGLPISIIRPFNVYGPGQSERAVIPSIISQVLRKNEVRLGSLTPRRDFTFVSDTARAFEMALANDWGEEPVNIGSGRSVTVGDLALRIKNRTAFNPPIVTDAQRVRPKKSEVHCLICDNSKATRLGWQPQVGLDDGLEIVINWMRLKLDELRSGEKLNAGGYSI